MVVVDTHWFTTIEHVISAHERRNGLFTSDELPRGMRAMPYDMPGDPELAHAFAAGAAGRDDAWVTAIDDAHLPVHYPTINLLGFLQGDERWVSMGVCQTADPDDFLLAGQLLPRRWPGSAAGSWCWPAAGSATGSGHCSSSATTRAPIPTFTYALPRPPRPTARCWPG